MKRILLSFLFLFIVACGCSKGGDFTSNRNNFNSQNQVPTVVDFSSFVVNGMNWDYIPIGTDAANANFWNKPDAIIKDGLDHDMQLLKDMGVNTLRIYVGIPAKWITYIYENYGIYTMLNHAFGRYGVLVNKTWVPTTDYGNTAVREQLLKEVKNLAETYKNTPGLILYLLGNENNYGLFWQGQETEDFPDNAVEQAFVGENRGRPMYNLMNEAAIAMKSIDTNHPVAICNGDLLFIDIIAEECSNVDIFGANVYRGATFTDLFEVVKQKLNKPVLLTEFGADAYNVKTQLKDEENQAVYMAKQWQGIYQNSKGMGKSENSIGGFTFQFSDGWWKYNANMSSGWNIHNAEASWANAAYAYDFVNGLNNMNEEWFGICSKGSIDSRGLYKLQPRKAYYALKKVHQLDLNTISNIQELNIKFNEIIESITNP